MFLLSVQNNYIEFTCTRACAKKIKSQSHVSGWFQGFQNLNFFFLKIYGRAGLAIIFRQKQFPGVPGYLIF